MLRFILAGIILFFAASYIGAPEVQAQEKNKYERINKKKNKQNRRLKRRGDKGKSNKGALRSSRLKTRNRQGERAYKGDITGRKVITKSSNRRSTAGRAAPNPYAGRKRRSEETVARKVLASPRYTARPSERSYKKPGSSRNFNSISGKGSFVGKRKYQDRRNQSISGQYNVRQAGSKRGRALKSVSSQMGYAGKRKYQGAKNQSISGKANKRLAGNTRGRGFNSISNRVGYAGKRKYQGGNYMSASKKGEQAKPRLGRGRSYNSVSKRGEQAANNGRGGMFKSMSGRISFTGKGRYQGRNVRSASRPSESKAVAGRVTPRSASGAYNVRKRRSPYSAFRKRKPWERAYKGDITGRTFRTKYTTERPVIQKPKKPRYSERTGKGDRAKLGFQPGYMSVSKGSENPTNRSVSGKRIAKNRTSPRPNFNKAAYLPYPKGKQKGDVAFKGKLKNGGFRTASRRGESTGNALPKSQKGDVGIPIFQGNLKARKPLKGGGSLARNDWNNDGKPTTKLSNNEQNRRTRTFQGNIKASKPQKGGGSIARGDWNNNGKPITKPSNNTQDRRIAGFTGNIKTKKPEKGGGSIHRDGWNNNGQPVTKNNETDENRRAMAHQGNIKRGFKYVKNPNAADEALKKRELAKTSARLNTLTARLKLPRGYDNKPHAADGALKGLGPSKAAISASNYQGNIKMNKRRISDAHPSLKYARLQNSATQEREKIFSFKLLFSKLFKKNEAQPDAVKEKERAPRFDKRERDIWYD